MTLVFIFIPISIGKSDKTQKYFKFVINTHFIQTKSHALGLLLYLKRDSFQFFEIIIDYLRETASGWSEPPAMVLAKRKKVLSHFRRQTFHKIIHHPYHDLLERYSMLILIAMEYES